MNPEVSGVVYRFTSGRASELIAAELGDFEGFLVGDGYSGNRAAADKVPGVIVLAGCWAHTIRKFRDALCETPGTAQLFQDDIKQLFEVEHEGLLLLVPSSLRSTLTRRHRQGKRAQECAAE